MTEKAGFMKLISEKSEHYNEKRKIAIFNSFEYRSLTKFTWDIASAKGWLFVCSENSKLSSAKHDDLTEEDFMKMPSRSFKELLKYE